MLRYSAILPGLMLGPWASVAAQQVIKPRIDATTTARLPKPASVTAAQQADGRIRVVWSAVQDAASYKVYRSVPPEGTKVLTLPNPTDTVYIDADVKAGSTHYYVVDAVNAAGLEGLKAGSNPVAARAITVPADTTPTLAPVAAPTDVVVTLGDYLRPKVSWKNTVPGARFVLERREDDGSDPTRVTWQTAVSLTDKSWTSCTTTCSIVEDTRPIRRNTMTQYRVTTVEAPPSTRKSEPVTSNSLLLELIPSAPPEIHVLNLVKGESRQVDHRPGTTQFHWGSLDTNTVSLWSPGVVIAKEYGTTFITATGLTPEGEIKMWVWRTRVGAKTQ